ncbi:MAG: glycerol-3-phosphate 1-O-acyltransferase PlsY [Mariprofundaceae bacterium]|nr:glycerol-3-phosphate 1-O-acyltransferase PlsY [Mariprofundaceae bacterium]
MSGIILIAAITAYLIGSIPFGLLFARWLTGKDPRSHGSGNIGATNAMRTGGKKVGAFTLLADILKGAIPVAIAIMLDSEQLLVATVALAAFIGHIFPIYLGFKGGKGVATMFGVVIPWIPWVAVGSFAVWLIVFRLTRYVSLASIIAGIVLPLFAWLLAASTEAVAACLLLGGLMTARHYSNIGRLWAGVEPKTGSS